MKIKRLFKITLLIILAFICIVMTFVSINSMPLNSNYDIIKRLGLQFLIALLIMYLIIIILNYKNKKKYIKIAGLIYEDEVKSLKKYITIVNLEFIEKRLCYGQELKTYQITICAKDLDKLKKIMRDKDCLYNVRKR